jgi:hypothetical protein
MDELPDLTRPPAPPPPPLSVAGNRGVIRWSGSPLERPVWCRPPPKRFEARESSRGKYLGVRGLSMSSTAVGGVITSSSSTPASLVKSKDFRQVFVRETTDDDTPAVLLLSLPPLSWLMLPRRLAMLTECPLMGRLLRGLRGDAAAAAVRDLTRDRRGGSPSVMLMPLSLVALELAVLAYTAAHKQIGQKLGCYHCVKMCFRLDQKKSIWKWNFSVSLAREYFKESMGNCGLHVFYAIFLKRQ